MPGLVCPHADKIQSNGVLRADDFDAMMLRHSGENGLCIDHFAALILDGEDYRVLALADKLGSVAEDGSFSKERKGTPGLWIKHVDSDRVKTSLGE